MKLSDYLPEVPVLAQQITDLNSQINMLQLMKASNETGHTPSIGLDNIVNSMLQNQMAYRQQLLLDLQTIAMTVEEIRGPVGHITSEVFRRGFEWKATIDGADKEQLYEFNKFMDNCNSFDQSLEEVLRQFHFDLNILDDAFLYIAKTYHVNDENTITSKVDEIRRLNPSMVEYDLDKNGLPKRSHYLCVIHRKKVSLESGNCEECGRPLEGAMYKYTHRNNVIFLLDNEIIHISKFSPSETYGWSPILTIFEKSLTLIGMDRQLHNYFYNRKLPGSMLMVHTDDPESIRRERANIAAQMRLDPNFVPMVAVSSQNNRGRVDLVRMFHTLQEMDYLPVRTEIRERIAAMWGVSPAWQGAADAYGGLSTQTQQLVVMSRVVEGDQRLFHTKILPQLLACFNITEWELTLKVPEEKAEATRISFAQQRVSMASQLNGMGFTVTIANAKNDIGVPVEDAQFMVANKPEEEPQDMTSFFNEMPADRDIDEWAAAREKKGEDRAYGFQRLSGRPPKGAKKQDIK